MIVINERGNENMHCGYVVKVDKLRKHENADKLQIATFFGNDTCVGLDVTVGEVGIYFPSVPISVRAKPHSSLKYPDFPKKMPFLVSISSRN